MKLVEMSLNNCRQTQWDPPAWDAVSTEEDDEDEDDMDLGTPTNDDGKVWC
jgi:hypothetical protein